MLREMKFKNNQNILADPTRPYSSALSHPASPGQARDWPVQVLATYHQDVMKSDLAPVLPEPHSLAFPTLDGSPSPYPVGGPHSARSPASPLERPVSGPGLALASCLPFPPHGYPSEPWESFLLSFSHKTSMEELLLARLRSNTN